MDVSLSKRCCCFVPLRHGLIAWGYLKLVMACTLFSMLLYIMSQIGVIALYVFGAIVLAMTISLTITFIYAIHKRHFKLLTVYYYCSIIENVLGALLVGGLILIIVAVRASGLSGEFILSFLMPVIILTTLAVVLQTYVTFLLRDSVVKMEERECYKSLNNIYDDDEYMYE